MKKRYFIITGIIAYLVFLIVSIPAAPVVSLLDRYMPAVSIQGISGSLWHGHAAAIRINRQYVLNNTDWNLNGWHLLTGEVSAHIRTHYQQQLIDGNAAISATGKISADNMRVAVNATTLAQIFRIPLAHLGGTIALDIDRLEWKQNQIPRASGHLLWNGASVTVSETAALGNVAIAFAENAKHPLSASISNQGGDIKLEGKASVGEDGNYSVTLNMLPNKTADQDIRSSLRMFAKPKPDGSYQLDNHGNLKTFGLI